MVYQRKNKALSGAKALLITQFAFSFILACVLFLFSFNGVWFYSSLLGGIVCVLPNFMFTKLFFAHYGARQANQIVRNFYIGEVVKMLLAFVLLILCLKLLKLSAPVFIISFIITQQIYWVAPFFMRTKMAWGSV